MSFCTTTIVLATLAILPADTLQVPCDIDYDSTAGFGSQHAAPEIRAKFSVTRSRSECREGHCKDSDREDPLKHWTLSSLDAPPTWPTVPLGPIEVEIKFDDKRIKIADVQFVELTLDGETLSPTESSIDNPTTYRLPCPAPGKHVLRARYLLGNDWSVRSPPLRFVIQLPKRPRIVALADWKQIPIVPHHSGYTSISSGAIKIHLADIGDHDCVVAYVNGQPIKTQASNKQTCCRKVHVTGRLTPGIHTLTVRTVGCLEDCSVTSKSSNEVRFHYYDEEIYLLKPGRGCDNKPISACNCKKLSKILQSDDQEESLANHQKEIMSKLELVPSTASQYVTNTNLRIQPRFQQATDPATAGHAQPEHWLDSYILLASASPIHTRAAHLLTDAIKIRDLTAQRAAFEEARIFANDSHVQARNPGAAEQARKNIEWQLNRIKTAIHTVEGQIAPTQVHLSNAANEKQLAEQQSQIVRHGAKKLIARFASVPVAADNPASAAEVHAECEDTKMEVCPKTFYFASAAHFPLPGFKLNGAMIDRGGLVIYEDMKFSVYPTGKYEVHFCATTPEMPTTLRLQFQIQPCQLGPWYTVTLSPIRFEYSASDAVTQKHETCGSDCQREEGKQCCSPTRECVCEGRSEILRRCYAEMSKNPSIRRHGTARFGHGIVD